MSMGRNFVPVHPSQVVEADPWQNEVAESSTEDLELLVSRGDNEQAILDLLLRDGASGDQLLKIAVRDPGLAARLLARSIEERRRERKTIKDPPAVAPPQPEVPRVQRILVVEDDHPARETLVRFLSGLGYEVDQARNGQEAMLRFHKSEPDFVLCDVYMPRMNGFKVLMEIKNFTPDMPILLMTGSAAVSQVFESFRYANVG